MTQIEGSFCGLLSAFFSTATCLVLGALEADGLHERYPGDLASLVLLEDIGFNTRVISGILALQMHDVEHILPEIVVTGNVSLEAIRVFIELKRSKKESLTVFLSMLQMKQMLRMSRSMDCLRSLSCAKVSMMIPNRMFTITMMTRMWKVQSNANFTKNISLLS